MGWRTIVVTCSTSFMLGSTFTHWIADHNTLWTSPVTPAAISTSLSYYSILGRSPPALYWAWMGVAAACAAGSGWRVVRGMMGMGGSGVGGGFLFDGGSLVLLLAALYTQTNEVQQAIAAVTAATSRLPAVPDATFALAADEQAQLLVRGLAGSNVLISVALTGIMFLQAGRYYSERADRKARAAELARRSAHAAAGTSTESSRASSPEAFASSVKRAGTPFRELTEEEAMEEAGEVDAQATRRGSKGAVKQGVKG